MLSGESIRSENINEIVKAYSGDPWGEGCVVAGEWTNGDWEKKLRHEIWKTKRFVGRKWSKRMTWIGFKEIFKGLWVSMSTRVEGNVLKRCRCQYWLNLKGVKSKEGRACLRHVMLSDLSISASPSFPAILNSESSISSRLPNSISWLLLRL